MGIAKAYSALLFGLDCHIVHIEVDITNGLHSFSIVGLGDRAVEEAKDRISAAIKNSGYMSPKQKNHKIVISLAPAHIKKEGPFFDLAMAMSYLRAVGEIYGDLEEYLFLGELALDGSIRRVYGTLPILRQAIARGFKKAIIPIENEYEASFIHGIDIYEASNLAEVINHIENTRLLSQVKNREINQDETFHSTDFKDIKGNSLAKRGLEIAASGGHNLLMYGPPGTGKTLLAKSFISILPKLSPEEVIEVMSIYSASKINENKIFIHPPFRSPHHTASYASIVGGGAYPRPGEITLAHRGVLFLDELPEFNRDVLEALRQPLEERCITIARAQGSVLFPAHCIFVASMNPCPCGRGNKGCTCPPKIIEAYKRRLSGPILDRIDITFSVEKVDYDRLAMKDSLRKIEDNEKEETSREVLQRVILARNIQKNRFQEQIYLNSEMNPKHIEKYSNLESSAKNILAQMGEKMNLSGRGLHRTIKVARTIADMADSEKIKDTHILEALQYRQNI